MQLPSFVELAARFPCIKSLIVFDYDDRVTQERSIVEGRHGSRRPREEIGREMNRRY